MNSEPLDNSSGVKQIFWTPMRIVAICVIVGVAIAVWLSSRGPSDQTNQAGVASTNPGTTTVNPALANPNTSTRNAAAPPVTPPLTEDIQQTRVKTIDGGSLKLADYKNKVVVLNIWATWCGPCRLEMPELIKMSNEYKSRGLVVLGLASAYRETEEQVKAYVETQKVPYKILWDGGTLEAPLVELVQGQSVIPQSFVISRDGKIIKHFQGFSPMSTPTLMRQAVEEALDDKGKA
jgi:thiol-disulfide isomerase/thioredoxin